MRITIIGGAGHVGTYLVPMLVQAGHQVTNVTRGQSRPYLPHRAWDQVTQVTMNRAAPDFADSVAATTPDAVIDMICFTPAQHEALAQALRGRITHLIHIGTIWVHGRPGPSPTREEDPRQPFGDYGIQKSLLEDLILTEARKGGLPATVIRPGHIVGPGWVPLNPAGNFNPQVFRDIAAGRPLTLPNFGLETVHHVHAEDVAQAVLGALTHWSTAVGESFNAVSPAALNLRHYAEALYRHFGHEPALSFAPFETWAKSQSPEDAEATWEHIARSPCHAIDKARRLIGYQPRHTSLQAVIEALTALPGGL
ncbi:NAD-dependent epimerase/dehydratase family protein [Stagnihabitans tardus]|uniref:NAD-dependent epimerase/dehydratase family protein n=1 Tax=Stagnihabitans tardus TaxID=2699202 RepID=A0AAE4YC97_9RHOB|nr:NAD-dependent epimerase/dehydratase family protein [Stagnihabitans tardus]NBZ87280.1 NAD-dependent epimerase/dehydratase family protein [Stagnihabitans tardus]